MTDITQLRGALDKAVDAHMTTLFVNLVHNIEAKNSDKDCADMFSRGLANVMHAYDIASSVVGKQA